MRISGSSFIRFVAILAVVVFTCSVDGQDRGNRGNRGDTNAGNQDQGQQQGRRGRGGEFGGRGGRGGGGFGGFAGFGRGVTNFSVEQDFLRRDVPLFIDVLQMDSSQRMIFEMLFTDYEGAFRDLMEFYQNKQGELVPELAPDVQRQQQELRDQMSELNTERQRMTELLPEGPDRDRVLEALRNRQNQLREETRDISQQQRTNQADQGVYAAIERIQSEWTAMNAQIREEFVSNVLVTLGPEQQSLWQVLDRRLRREKTLSDGQLSGESVNLFSVVRDQQFGEDIEATLQPILDEYDITLDDVLRRRNTYLETSTPKLTQAYQEQEFDRGLSIVTQQTTLRKAVRDLTDNYAQIIIGALPEAEAASFKAAYRRSAYPRIYQTTRAERAFDAAKSLEGLSPETVEAIVLLESSYQLELNPNNERLVTLTKRHEPDSTRNMAEWLIARMSGEQVDRPEDPVREAYSARDELDGRYIQRLKPLLTPEQFETLPSANQRGRVGRGGFGNAGGRGQRGGDGGGGRRGGRGGG